MTELYIISIDEVALLPDEYIKAHLGGRYEKSKRFLKNEDRLRCIGAGALLQFALQIDFAKIEYGEHKKPYIKNSNKQFNLSHSGKYIILAVDDDEIGADIEVVDKSHLELKRTVYQKEEIEYMDESPLTRFFVLWTIKESVMKATGKGFYLSPKSFSVLPLIQGESIEVDGQKLYSSTFSLDNHVVSLCAGHKFDKIEVKTVTAGDILR